MNCYSGNAGWVKGELASKEKLLPWNNFNRVIRYVHRGPEADHFEDTVLDVLFRFHIVYLNTATEWVTALGKPLSIKNRAGIISAGVTAVLSRFPVTGCRLF